MAAPINAAALQALPGVPCIDKCIPPGFQMAIAISLLAKWGGLSTNPVVLESNARCFQCIPGNMQKSVAVSLATKLLAAFSSVLLCADADANSFLSTAQISDTPTSSAVCTLVGSLKSSGVWPLMDAVYPFVGGTAASNAVNLKNPSSYAITWNGGVTFSALGVTGDGISGYGNTNFTPSTAAGSYSVNSASIGVFSGTENVEFKTVIGVNSGSSSVIYFNGQQQRFTGLNSIAFSGNIPVTTTKGFTCLSLQSAVSLTYYATDGTSGAMAQLAASLPTSPIFLLTNDQNGLPDVYATKTLSFAFIGGGMTPTQVAAFKSAIIAFNTVLGR